MSKGLFITGTGTDIGKTYVSALLVKQLRSAGLNAGYYKAAVSGNERKNGRLIPGDCKYVADTAGLPNDPAELVSYIYETAVSPHLAAKLEGTEAELCKIEADFKKLLTVFDYVLMEGSGGLICPIRTGSQTIMLEDFIHMFGMDVLLVADSGLGTLNSVVLSYDYAKNHRIPLRGVLMNRYDPENFLHRDNRQMIERLTGLPVLSCIPENDKDCHIDAQALAGIFSEIQFKQKNPQGGPRP